MKGVYSCFVFVSLLLWCAWQPAIAQHGSLSTFRYNTGFEKGKVQQIYIYDISPGKKELLMEARYDSVGHLLVSRSYISGKLNGKDSAVYDKWGNRAEYYMFYGRDLYHVDHPEPSYSIITRYDSLGNPVENEMKDSRDTYKTTYTYDENNRLLARKEYMIDGHSYILTDAHKYEYSPDMHTDIEIRYDRDKVKYYTTTKKYDAAGKLAGKYVQQTESASPHTYTYEVRYVYDKNGNLTGSIHDKKKNRKIIEKYTDRYIRNARDSIVFTRYHKGPRGKQTSKKIYRFNDNSQITEYHYFVSDSLVEKEISRYDSLQHRLLYTRYDHRGMAYQEENVYDDFRLVKQVKSGSDGEKEVRHTYIYTYDASGNWIQLEMFLNDELFRTVQREMIYFE